MGMVDWGQLREPCVLVVGAGLTGACLAWLLSRAGRRVCLVSVDRPASQTTALVPGIVHGLGPPGGPEQWLRADDQTRFRARHRSRRGFELLQEVLFSAARLTGYTPCEHRLAVPSTMSRRSVEEICQRLQQAGFELTCESTDDQLCFLRRRDAIVHIRGLTFEILRQARGFGADLRFGQATHGDLRETPEGVLVGVGGDEELFEKIYWAGGSALPGRAKSAAYRSRMVIHQVLAEGQTPLSEILETASGDLLLTPRSDGHEGVVLVRYARATNNGGPDWPALPMGWKQFCGPALRQRLSETLVGSPQRRVRSSGRFVPMSGFYGWPVTALMGACLEAVPEAEEILSVSATAGLGS